MDCSAYSFIENTGFLLLFPMKTTLQTFQWFYVLICVFFFFFLSHLSLQADLRQHG